MPRGRRATAPDGTPVPPAEKIERPEGLTDEEWTLGRKLGNVSLACSMLAVADGERAPKNAAETTDFMRASAKLRDQSLKRYLRLRETLQGKLDAGLAEYQLGKNRVDAFELLMIDPQALVKARAASGQDSPEE